MLGRGACDDKGQAMTFVEACRAWKAVTGTLPVDLTLLIEGEEECGSINLPEFVKANTKELKADAALVCDTGMWDRRTPAITQALRGMAYEEVKITAADRDLHSGVFGGGAANPINVLTRMLGGLKNDEGRIMLDNFYDGVHELPSQQKADWAALNLTADDFLGQVGLSEPVGEKGRLLIEMVQSRPTADINGIWGGYIGAGSKTVIPSEASAKVSFRLVGDQDPKKVSAAFEKFVRERLPKDCKAEFIHHASGTPIALPFDSPLITKARDALLTEWGKAPVTIGSGGSVPIVGDFKRMLGMDSRWSASASTMTGCIHPMRNTTCRASTTACAPGPASSARWPGEALMPKLRVNSFSVSLDGYGAGPNQDLANPMGVGGMALHGWALATRTFRTMFGKEDGTAGMDEAFAARGFENLGAWILGRNMFGPVRGPWPDESWKGWWDDNPPYHVPVFILTHHARAPIPMEGGTTFHFVTEGIEAALDRARDAAKNKDVRLGGGVATSRQYLQPGSSTRCTWPSRRSSSAPGSIFSAASTCPSWAIGAPSMSRPKPPPMSC